MAQDHNISGRVGFLHKQKPTQVMTPGGQLNSREFLVFR